MGGPPSRFIGADPEKIKGVTLSKGTTKRVLELARPYKSMLIAYVATILVAALLALVPPLLFRQIIDVAIPSSDLALLNVLAVLVVAAAIGDAVLSLTERWVSARIGEGVIFDLRVSLFDHVQRLPMGFFTRTQTGALMSRMNNDVIGAQRALTTTLGTVVSNVVVLVTTLAAMVVLEWRLTLLALALLPLFILPAKRVGRALQRITRQSMHLDAQMNAQMTERFNVSGALLVKLFGNFARETDEFSGRAKRVRDIGVRSALYGRTFFIALTLVGAVGTVAVYWVGGHMVISGALTIGTLVAMAAFVTRIYGPLTSLSNAPVDVMTALVSFDRVFEVLDTPPLIADRPGAVELTEPRGEIEIDDVWFRYPSPAEVSIASLEADGTSPLDSGEGPFVLQGITVSIPAGSSVALVGPSGAGKTTLASLLSRLYDVTRGSVRIDGHDVRDITLESLQSAVGVVTQDPHLFHDSVLGNLRYAKADATQAEIEGACRAARIHDVIGALPEGYDTVVGERGYRLSGGEKQRLAIARVLLADPAVVVLDEATSHLDSENEAVIQEALASTLAGRTAVVIAHRLSTITSADQILVIEGGRLVERGTHSVLLSQGKRYADLYLTLFNEAGETTRA